MRSPTYEVAMGQWTYAVISHPAPEIAPGEAQRLCLEKENVRTRRGGARIEGLRTFTPALRIIAIRYYLFLPR